MIAGWEPLLPPLLTRSKATFHTPRNPRPTGPLSVTEKHRLNRLAHHLATASQQDKQRPRQPLAVSLAFAPMTIAEARTQSGYLEIRKPSQTGSAQNLRPETFCEKPAALPPPIAPLPYSVNRHRTANSAPSAGNACPVHLPRPIAYRKQKYAPHVDSAGAWRTSDSRNDSPCNHLHICASLIRRTHSLAEPTISAAVVQNGNPRDDRNAVSSRNTTQLN